MTATLRVEYVPIPKTSLTDLIGPEPMDRQGQPAQAQQLTTPSTMVTQEIISLMHFFFEFSVSYLQ